MTVVALVVVLIRGATVVVLFVLAGFCGFVTVVALAVVLNRGATVVVLVVLAGF